MGVYMMYSFWHYWRGQFQETADHAAIAPRIARIERQRNWEVLIAHGSVDFCELMPIGLVDESKESMYERETDRDLCSAWKACRYVTGFLFYLIFSERAMEGGGGGVENGPISVHNFLYK